MEQDSYSVPEVIEALRSVGVQEEVIEYIVPIAGYESRVGGVPFVRDALDKISPSWGIFQANIDSMAPGIYQAMKELGVELPGVTDKQDKILSTNKAKLSSEKNFTEEQKKFVANWFATEADLNANALVFKYTLATKMQDESTDDFKKAIDAAYVLTTQKFADLENDDAQALKKDLENQYSEYLNTPDDRGIPEPEEGFEPGPIPSTTTTTVPETSEIDTTTRSMGTPPREVDTTTRSSATKQFGTPPQDKMSPDFKKDSFLKYFDTVTSFRKKDPSTFKERSVAKPTEINFMGTPVTTQEIIDLLEP